MDANQLQLNAKKTRVMVISKNQNLKNDFQVTLNQKTVCHSPQIKILGNIFNDTLTWDIHIRQIVLPGLKNVVRNLRMTAKYLDIKFRICYTNYLFRSKLLFGIETWGGGVDKTTLQKIQVLQDQAAKIASGRDFKMDYARKKQARLGWLPIRSEVDFSLFVQVWKILNLKMPEELNVKMPKNETGRRIQMQKKLAKKPKWLDKCKIHGQSFRSRSYKYNTLPGNLTALDSQKKNLKKN